MALGTPSSSSASSPSALSIPRKSGSEDRSSAAPTIANGLGSHANAAIKRKRNKPTLNCAACVDRKTKCDRQKPECAACVRRDAACQYLDGVAMSARGTKSQRNGSKASITGVKARRRSSRSPTPTAVVLERLSTSLEPLLSNIPYPTFSAINIYGIGSEHPFKNYWTLSGGLEEVIDVLPSKEQADILIAKYFDAIDSIFPILHEGNFYALYEDFWRLPPANKGRVDASFVALLFVMLALGSQLLRLNIDPAVSHAIQGDGAEFYASACHQALHLGAYLNRTSVPMLQAMVLMTYFLMNANRGSDGWAFQGIVIRQAYAMGLNRDASMISKPKGTLAEQNEKRRLWMAVVAQDASMSVVLKLPPGATHMDADVTRPILPPPINWDITGKANNEAVEYPTGIGISSFGRSVDIGYSNGMFSLALLEQETISSPRSLSLQLAPTARQRVNLLDRFQASYDSWPELFRTWDEQSLCELGDTDPLGRRVVRQTFFLTSHYWHCVMLIHVEACDPPVESLKSDAAWDEHLVSVRGALKAAHSTLRAFFVLPRLLEGEAGSWWTMAHRAFAAALTLANLLKKHGQCPSATGQGDTWGRSEKDNAATASAFATARTDVLKTIMILKSISHHDEASKTCVEILEKLYGTVDVDVE